MRGTALGAVVSLLRRPEILRPTPEILQSLFDRC